MLYEILKYINTAAFSCAATHYVIFAYLDGRVIGSGHEPSPPDSTSVPQSYVTTTSLILVTGFRAALVASVGIAYTQYLWKNLRSRFLSVGYIEELFQIRSNPFRLLNYALLRLTPTLLVVATFSWLVPIAMIYPPGALVVGLDTRNVAESFNVSVFRPNNTYSLDTFNHGGFLHTGFAEVVNSPLSSEDNPLDLCDQSGYCNYVYSYGLPYPLFSFR